MVQEKDEARAVRLDVHNPRRRLIRALEVIEARGQVPARNTHADLSNTFPYKIEWVVIDPASG